MLYLVGGMGKWEKMGEKQKIKQLKALQSHAKHGSLEHSQDLGLEKPFNTAYDVSLVRFHDMG